MTSKPAFDDIYMELAVNLARRSHCIKRHVGAVLTRDTRIISIGYNGPPSGTHNCDEEWPGAGCPRDSKGGCSLAIHAEQNAILKLATSNESCEDSVLFLTHAPCMDCAKQIYTAGIRRVFFDTQYRSMDGVVFLENCNIKVEQINGETKEDIII